MGGLLVTAKAWGGGMCGDAPYSLGRRASIAGLPRLRCSSGRSPLLWRVTQAASKKLPIWPIPDFLARYRYMSWANGEEVSQRVPLEGPFRKVWV